MGAVYLAEDLKHHRRVAIKVLRPELAAGLGTDRFLREIEVAARLQHPAILPLHDSGETDGWVYYIMPYVEGESLRDRLARQGELPVEETVRILSELLDALAYAHGRASSTATSSPTTSCSRVGTRCCSTSAWRKR